MWRCCIKFKIKPEDGICAICRQELAEELCITLHCQHKYHQHCISKWEEIQRKVIKVSLDKSTCPECRKPFQLKQKKS